MTESERQAWEHERAQGRDRFILSGMLRRSVPSATFLTVVYFLVDLFMRSIASPLLEIGTLLAVFGGLILGIGWCEGAHVWYKHEREYKRLIGGDHVA